MVPNQMPRDGGDKEERQKRVLLISTDFSFRAKFRASFTELGYRILESDSQATAFTILEREPEIDAVFFDIEKMPASEVDLISFIRTRHSAEVVVLASINELEEASKTLRSGASFYLIKPIAIPDLKSVLEKLTARSQRQFEQKELEQRFLSDLMSGSQSMQKILKLSMKIAPTSSTVLIGGESGTGKEFFARIIHRMSKRYESRFVAMNCGAVPDALFESEFFGHKKGAFTGADRDKEGLVEAAHNGTLFLDEIGELSPPAQVKLLRFLQDREFRRIGDTSSRTVDVRVIAATNRDLRKQMQEGSFREDLYFRLNVFYLYLPPLRERKETIPTLVHLFLHRFNRLFNKNIIRVSKNAESIIANYSYPGNIRELENIIEHAVVLADGDEITERDLPDFMFRNRLLLSAPQADTSLSSPEKVMTLGEVEKAHIQFVLGLTSHNYTETAKKLGISRSTLWRKVKDYQLDEK
ncbi:sigma-54 dependent transcriptional regulator [Chitinispirillales bacterium ANBcel5]|uniref:sigma-54 dependent transcriptional regulator n=1 Tax=Cellulosispirillum alkaliphilum TaxID=3039283 RepID=UPI002A53DEF6|nr:sigma-54 dependent transcriptional regulator [Chitinispirillales bacterium ANBcel5]